MVDAERSAEVLCTSPPAVAADKCHRTTATTPLSGQPVFTNLHTHKAALQSRSLHPCPSLFPAKDQVPAHHPSSATGTTETDIQTVNVHPSICLSSVYLSALQYKSASSHESFSQYLHKGSTSLICNFLKILTLISLCTFLSFTFFKNQVII